MPIPVQCGCGAGFMATDEVAGTNQHCPQCGGVILVPYAPVAPAMPVAQPIPQAAPAVPVAQPGYAPAAPMARSRPSKVGYWIGISVGIFVIFTTLLVVFILFASGAFSSPSSTVATIVKNQKSGNYRKVYARLSAYGQRLWLDKMLYTILLRQRVSEEKTPNVYRLLQAHTTGNIRDGRTLVSQFRNKVRRQKGFESIVFELADAIRKDLPDRVKDLNVLPEDAQVIEMNIQRHGRRALGKIEYTRPGESTRMTKRVRLSNTDGNWLFDRAY